MAILVDFVKFFGVDVIYPLPYSNSASGRDRIDLYLMSERKVNDMNESYVEKKRKQ